MSSIFEKKFLREKKKVQILEKQIEDFSRDLFLSKEKELSQLKEIHKKEKREIELIESTKAKDFFMALVSHELRTPMNGILNMCSLLQESTLSEIQKDYLDTILNCSNEMMSLIAEILDHSKLLQGDFNIIKNTFSGKSLINRYKHIYSEQAELKKIDFELIHNNIDTKFFYSDELRIKQIIGNILSNAFKYTDEGKVTLNIKFENKKLKAEITDTGPGIPESDLPKIFESFYQAKNREEYIDQRTGLGLGLGIVKALIEKMKGTIHLENRKSSNGLKVKFEIPIKESSQNTQSKEETKTIVKLATVYPARVLVAEDNPVNQKIFRIHLKKMGYKADFACDGIEMLELTKSNDYDLILLDCYMPRLNGFKACKKFRQEKPNSKTAVIAVTASISATQQENYAQYGMDDCLAKPFTFESLEEKIKEQLKKILK